MTGKKTPLEVKDLLDKDYKEIILLGQNVNSYGLDKVKKVNHEVREAALG